MNTPTVKSYADQITSMLTGIGMSSDEIAVVLYQLDELITDAISDYYLTKASAAQKGEIDQNASPEEIAKLLSIEDSEVEALSIQKAQEYIEKLQASLPALQQQFLSLPK